MRDVLIHHYFGVKLETVWNVVESHLPTLLTSVDESLAENSSAQGDDVSRSNGNN